MSDRDRRDYDRGRDRDRDRDRDRSRGRDSHRDRDRERYSDRDRPRDYRRDDSGRDRKRHRSSSPKRDDDRRRPPPASGGNRRPHGKGKNDGPRIGADGKEQWGLPNDDDDKNEEDKPPKEEVNFGLSGKLTEDTNTVNGVVVIYSEPPEARSTQVKWRLYPFKGSEALDPIYIHRLSAFLIGKEKKVCDLFMAHPSISKQHAALQYRLVTDNSSGQPVNRIKPYIIDLDSTNGTFVNGKKIESRRYVELLERDRLKFGFSSREYVLLHENSADGVEADTTADDFINS